MVESNTTYESCRECAKHRDAERWEEKDGERSDEREREKEKRGKRRNVLESNNKREKGEEALIKTKV